MSQNRHEESADVSGRADGQGAIRLQDFDLPNGTWFPWHVHDSHQLLWAARGVVAVNVDDAHWVLPPTRALWVPAGTLHRTGATGHALLCGVHADPARCPVDWPVPRIIAVRPLLRELLRHLNRDRQSSGESARARAESVVFDLLEPVAVAPIRAPLPHDPRARRVADALLADPADRRGLVDLGRGVGASDRTLARLFLEECHMTFGRWRTQVRLAASLPLLASGMPLDGVARRVGYSSPSAFVAAFRRAVGTTPADYFRTP